MRIEVDIGLCQSNGLCCISAPDVFELDDDDILRYEVAPDESLRDAVAEAEQGCPVQAITVSDD